jgi:predicted ATPase
VMLYRIVRASGGGRRSGARQLTPLVGREEEMAMLMRRWERARQGDGQLVLIVGEPGLGKSRLIEEFHARLSEVPHTWVEWSCSQLLQNTPLHPIAEWGRQRFGGADLPAERRLADLEASLAQVKLDPAENAPLLAPLLDIPLSNDRALSLAPEELRRRQLAALTNWVLAGAKVQPVVLAFEDLHWADPTTLDVLRAIAERGAPVPLYIVATTRPEFRPPWSMRSHHGTISLAPLDRGQVHDMVAELSARHALPKEVIDDVAARTGGVPLFVEEVTRLLLERGEQGGTQAIPPTPQQSLMARLDRLGPARELAQIGSVIGRGFPYALIRAVAGMEDAPLQAALEKLAEADILLVQGAPPDSDYRFKHALIQDAAYENLLKSRRQALHRRVAEILRDEFPAMAAAEPEVLAHHFTQAGLHDAAIEWWGKAGDQALRRSAFKEATAHLGKAIEMADKAASAVAPQGSDRLRLQISYGNALISARGYGAQETTAAFARARELAAQAEDAADRFSVYYGLWVGPFTRGELAPMRQAVQALLRDCESQPKSPEAGIAHRLAGTTNWYAGDFEEARVYLEHALAIFDPRRDRDLAYRFGHDVGVAEMAYLAMVRWLLGDVDRAWRLAEEMVTQAIQTGHIPTIVYGHMHKAIFELMRRNPSAAAPHVEAFVDLARQRGMPNWLAYGRFFEPWARWHLAGRDGGLTDMRQAIAMLREQGVALYTIALETVLAEVEAEEGQLETANATVDRALAETERTGHRWFGSETHRIRGEILFKRDPVDIAPTEDAFLTAIAIAQQQKARSFELRAALALAKLYQSTRRAADAHLVLAPALEGFSPTPEFPEIAEAQNLIASLAEADEVKSAAASRQRRLKLQTAYGNALIAARGYQAADTTAAFVRARELAAGVEDLSERFSVYYGQWAGSFVRADLMPMREIAQIMLRDCRNRPNSPEAGIAHRLSGETHWFAGNFGEARADLERALAIFDPERDRELAFHFGQDVAVTANSFLACVLWPLGEVDRARRLAEEMVVRAVRGGHIATIAWVRVVHALFEVMFGNPVRATTNVTEAVAVAREHGMKLWMAFGGFLEPWAHSHRDDRDASIKGMLHGIAMLEEQGVWLYGPLLRTALAKAKAEADQFESALATIDRAIAETERTGQRWYEAESHRIRGEILLKRDPANTVPAEEAFLTAIAVAQQQKARSFELRAARSLAMLYQSTGRAADAVAVLTPAFAGFSPTPEFPEIEEARSLLAAMAENDEVKNATASRQRRLKLQTAYANALIHARGHGAPETSAAFAKAQTLAAGLGEAADHFSAYYGQWVGSLNRCEPAVMQEVAAAFLRETELRPDSPEAGVAYRISGLTRLYFGDYAEARANIEKALAVLDSERDRDLAFRFGQDQVAAAMIYMALVIWPLGDVERARQFADQAESQAAKSGNVQTLAYVNYHLCLFEALRGDRERAAPVATAVLDLARERAMPIWESAGRVFHGWANWLVGDQQMELAEMRRGIERWRELGQAFHRPYLGALLAEAEASAGNLDIAIGELDRFLAEAQSTGERWSDAELHRVRGELLIKRDPTNTMPAEEAFLAAIAIAQRQKARSFELRAAMSMARLWRDQGKRDQARDLLAPIYGWFTEGFDTLDLKEAKALLDEIAA